MASKGQPARAWPPGTPAPSPSARRCRSCSAASERCWAGAALLLSPASSAPAASLIAWAALPRGDSGGQHEPGSRCDFFPVLANRDVLALMVGYAAAIWGCVGLRQWIIVFLTFCAGDQANDPAQAWVILAVGAVISFLGVPAGLIGTTSSVTACAIATLVFVLSAVAGGFSASPRCCPSWPC